MFRFTASNDQRREAAVANCVEFLADELGKRCRVVLETATVGRLKFQDFILKVPEMTPTLLRKLDSGMAECCRRMKVKYYFLGYGEEVYKHASWKTLGTVLQPVEPPPESIGDLDCRKLRFDGLYFNKTGDSDGNYLRFYPDGQCIAVYVSGPGDASDVARWFTREWKRAAVGTYKVQGSSLSAVIEYGLPNEEPTIKKLKGRLTKQGVKVRAWNSHTNKEFPELYVFHNVKLK
jgi:hypothetical protein